jgi:hypothetical protein
VLRERLPADVVQCENPRICRCVRDRHPRGNRCRSWHRACT